MRARFRARVADVSSLLIARDYRFKREFRARVTYHDSCHLAHGLGVREGPRQLIRSIPGVELIELGEADLCCGSAGSYKPDRARDGWRTRSAQG